MDRIVPRHSFLAPGCGRFTLCPCVISALPHSASPDRCSSHILGCSIREGSFGLVLNRPASQAVSDILPERDLGSLARVPVFFGGPVSRDQLVFASFRWQANHRRMECRHHIGIEEAEKLLVDKLATVRAYIGYAGWSKGQLEGELAQHAWMTRAPDENLLDPTRTDAMWREMLSGFGPMFRLIAEAPDDPARN
jgi:putative transcriptional regulator